MWYVHPKVLPPGSHRCILLSNHYPDRKRCNAGRCSPKGNKPLPTSTPQQRPCGNKEHWILKWWWKTQTPICLLLLWSITPNALDFLKSEMMATHMYAMTDTRIPYIHTHAQIRMTPLPNPFGLLQAFLWYWHRWWSTQLISLLASIYHIHQLDEMCHFEIFCILGWLQFILCGQCTCL